MTVVSMFAIGVIQANGGEESKALVGISGLGHILITAGIIIYIATINKALKTSPVKCWKYANSVKTKNYFFRYSAYVWLPLWPGTI